MVIAAALRMDLTPFERKRRRMTELQLASRGIARQSVLHAFATVPREAFVPRELEDRAYDDCPLPIGDEQTISQPYVVARTIDALDLDGGERVLEIGTGSGYAAALLGMVAREVYTVERIGWLAAKAEARLARLDCTNVRVRQGDGSLGWPEHAPYDAIAVAAGGPVVPQALLDQLAIGGRLVMPVTRRSGFGQALVRVKRVSVTDYEQDELEPVHFVPLIGAHGYATAHDDEPRVIAAPRLAKPGTGPAASRLVREVAEPIRDLSADPAIDALVERLAPARLVLLGESTHGTSEFYRTRARITQQLIARHGFDFVAAEADWPDAARVDAYVRGARAPAQRLASFTPFTRFPTWMWRNEEVLAFAEWLRTHNAAREPADVGVGFHGLDLYSMYTSIRVVVSYLNDVDPVAAHDARTRYARLMPWQGAPESYGIAVVTGRLETAETMVVGMLRELLRRRLDYVRADGGRFFDAAQNARVIASAEQYYRAMFYGSAASWNLRDAHMFETLRTLLAHYGPTSKGIVWAHNSHVGDARATGMSEREERNIGQLCKQAFGEHAMLVGFSTGHGTVLAAREWDELGSSMFVRPGHPESYEHIFHEAGLPAFVLRLRDPVRGAVREELGQARLLRAIGVVYSPETELESHYQHTVLPEQFDELIWFDATGAVTPLPLPLAGAAELADLAETHPFAV